MDALSRAILDAVLTCHGNGSKQVVDRDTTKERFESPQDTQAIERSWDFFNYALPGLRRDTFEDFEQKKKDSVDAQEVFGEHPELFFRPIKDVLAGGWDGFQKAYPESFGAMEISRPGVSIDHRQALICIGDHHEVWGVGKYYLCESDGAEWRVIDKCTAWRAD